MLFRGSGANCGGGFSRAVGVSDRGATDAGGRGEVAVKVYFYRLAQIAVLTYQPCQSSWISRVFKVFRAVWSAGTSCAANENGVKLCIALRSDIYRKGECSLE